MAPPRTFIVATAEQLSTIESVKLSDPDDCMQPPDAGKKIGA